MSMNAHLYSSQNEFNLRQTPTNVSYHIVLNGSKPSSFKEATIRYVQYLIRSVYKYGDASDTLLLAEHIHDLYTWINENKECSPKWDVW